MKPEGKLISISPEIQELTDEEILQEDLSECFLPSAIIKEAVVNLGVSAIKAAEAMSNFRKLFSNLVDTCCDFIYAYTDAVTTKSIIDNAPNGRVKHLALHAKKRRARKKNAARLVREIANHENIFSIDEIHAHKADIEMIFTAPRTNSGGKGNDSNNN